MNPNAAVFVPSQPWSGNNIQEWQGTPSDLCGIRSAGDWKYNQWAAPPQELHSSAAGKLNTDIVSTEDELRKVLEQLAEHTCIAVDCEGADLSKGSWRDGQLIQDPHVPLHGQLCTIQIGVPGKAFAIDIFELGARAFDVGLRGLLESQDVVKVVHDFRQDEDALWHQFRVLPRRVFDCQLCDVLTRRLQGFRTTYVQGSAKLIAAHGIELATVPGYGALTQDQKVEIHARFSRDRHLWARRPLPPEMVLYAKADVLPLPQLYKKQLRILSEMVGGEAAALRLMRIGSAAYGSSFRVLPTCRCRLCCAAEENARFDGCTVFQQMSASAELDPGIWPYVQRQEDAIPLPEPGPSKFRVNEYDESVPLVPA